ncbi:acyl--CoA ligase [Sphingobium sp. TB-6]|uniref:class I adenylate-forming enzyme family protein n=1 Tax=Sphingobium sp. TB-6 TaxID=2728850 RepID=UPI00146ACE3D|nr:class I adenylate-forming enzyme family protein [Sphingobium sp. TB-6]NML91837.1 acyl--CoA ligase [Sphingobium sp. TB-6]|tara:strand:- start:6169 stop:7782 length:1614 start_codon:yes stop_codon:yes gene_type:complete
MGSTFPYSVAVGNGAQMQKSKARFEILRRIEDGDPVFSRKDYADVVTMFWDTVEACPDQIALVDGDRRLSYAQFGAAVAGLAGRIGEKVTPSARVAICMSNSIEANVAIFAALSAGAEISIVNAGYTPREIDTLFNIAPPELVLAGQSNSEVAGASARNAEAPLIIVGEGGVSIDALLDTPPTRPDVEIMGASPCIIMFTGGSTGAPKGVQRDHRSEMSVIKAMHTAWPTRLQEEVWLNVAPVSHVWGIHMGCFNPVYGRSCLIIVPRFHPDLVAGLMEKYRVSVFSGGPAAIYQGLLAAPDTDMSALWLCPGGGSVFSRQTLSRWEAKTGLPILEAFGMTEGGPLTAQPLDGTHQYGTAGLPLPGIEVAIVALDGSGERLSANENGEIFLRGERVIDRYMGLPPVAEDGWLPTGDIGFLTPDGFLTVVDRKKDMLIVGGFNVYPSEIEQVLSLVPEVSDAAVVSVPDSRKGEAPFAFVAASPQSGVDEKFLMEHCAKNMTKYKIPRNIVVLDEIPKTPARKPDKKRLKEMANELLE